MPDNDKALDISDDAIYTAVASRRAGFDSMAWQVPIISLTAQAFLFTVALAPDSFPVARYMTASLALVVTVLSMILLARHRQADVADAGWLEKLEKRNGRREKNLVAHGKSWRKRRDRAEIWEGNPINVARHWGAFKIWQFGLFLFGVAALIVIGLTIWAPHLLGPTS